VAYPGREIEWTGYSKLSARNAIKAGRCLRSERTKETDEGLAGLLGGVRRADHMADPISTLQANRGGDMATSNIVSENRLSQIGDHEKYQKVTVSSIAYLTLLERQNFFSVKEY
jgi:hypothetical protein